MPFQTKYFDNAKWILLFHHNYTKAGFFTASEVQNCDKEGKYSILSELSSLCQYRDSFEFLLEYPSLDYIRWTQTKNPTKINEDSSTTKDTLGVVFKHNTYKYFRGLAVTNKRIWSYLDGDSRDTDDYWFSIGTISFSDYIPGPDCISVKQCWLWLRIPWERTISSNPQTMPQHLLYCFIAFYT